AGAVLATLFAVRESRDETVGREIDWAGTAVLTGGLTALVLALVEGNAWGWGSARIIALFVAATLLLAMFLLVESRVKAPIIQFEFLRNRNFVGATLVAFVISFSMLGMFFFMALYIQNILGYSPLEAGVRFLPTTLVIMVLAPIAGRLTDRIGPRPLIAAGLGIVSVSLFMQSMIDIDSGYSTLLVPFILMGVGIALTMSPMSTAAMNAVAETKAGLASGLLSMSRMVGGTFGIAVLGAVFQANSRSDLSAALAPLGIGEGRIDAIAEQLGSGGLDATIAGLPTTQVQEVGDAAREAFINSLAGAIEISAFVAAAGAILALVLISAKRKAPSDAADLLEAQPATPELAAGRPD
ncbi:MAG: MFS transporter, partial [Solirubrobacterales bacterium]